MTNTGSLPSSSVVPSRAADRPRYRRVVVKAGTSVLTKPPDHQGLNLEVMGDLARQICGLGSSGIEVLLVSSGAIAAGREALGSGKTVGTPDIATRQVMAAVGQSRIMHTYQELFAVHGGLVAQTLLTIKDLSDRQSYLNLRTTLRGLLESGVVPILNENDVVAVDEIGEVFGDNDRLSALVANLMDADLLVILTDIDGLYTADPNVDATAQFIAEVEHVDASIEAMAGRNRHPWARGGMATKLEAARLVTTSGISMIMCRGMAEDAVTKAASGQAIGTLFKPAGSKLEARKRWMLGNVSHQGGVVVDAGAARALQQNHKSLLPAGIAQVSGNFGRGDIIYISDNEGRAIACGIVNYSSGDVESIRGLRSGQIAETLGYQYGQEVVHRNHLVLL